MRGEDIIWGQTNSCLFTLPLAGIAGHWACRFGWFTMRTAEGEIWFIRVMSARRGVWSRMAAHGVGGKLALAIRNAALQDLTPSM
ncbi:hypothetical protein AKJ60_01205 [candidate division MSBL1 archaeon SCGC-AAA385M11]|nr:hypothetical protein AKJ60_01205 [candidate division MSBL1 archaeon SCGC-AAA385M11]